MTRPLLLIFVLLTAACEKLDLKKSIQLEGDYTGTFVRYGPATDYAPSNVTLTLKDGKFSGSGDSPNYPAICSGTYKVTGGEIEFSNECVWIAAFDWTFILSGKFSVHLDGNTVEMTKVSETGVTDTYRLTRQ